MELNTTFFVRLFQVGVFLLFCYNESRGEQVEMSIKTTVKSQSFINTSFRTKNWNCLLHRPDSFREKDKWPLIIFLHSELFRGSDINLVKRQGLPKILDSETDFPFVVLSPQLPLQEEWDPKSLMALVDEAIKRFKIDPLRVYVTGVSDGAAGAWDLAALDQTKFAALVPVCGFSEDKDIVKKVIDIPIWAFHGSADRVRDVGPHSRLIGAVLASGGDRDNVRLTVVPNATHGSVVFPTYDNKALYDWMLSHSREVKPVAKVREVQPLKPKPKPNGAIFKNSQPVDNGIINNGGITRALPIGKGQLYKVKKGDTLWSISRKFGVTVKAIQKENGLRGSVIQIGQDLKLPQKPSAQQ